MDKDICISNILEVFAENGIILSFGGEDLSLSDYIDDSIQFMTILVQLEEKFDIEFPDEVLQIDCFSSLFGLSDIICELKEPKKSKT